MESFRSDDRLAVRIKRDVNATLPLIDMSYGSVILSDTYSELSLLLPTDRVYGQGGGALSFRSAQDPANYTK